MPNVALDKIPSEAQDLHSYFPHIGHVNADTVEVSHLIIPPESAHSSLRRILSILVRILAPSIDNDGLLNIVCQAESQVLQHNNNFYTELEILLSIEPAGNVSSQAIEALLSLSQTQKERLAGYQARLVS